MMTPSQMEFYMVNGLGEGFEPNNPVELRHGFRNFGKILASGALPVYSEATATNVLGP